MSEKLKNSGSGNESDEDEDTQMESIRKYFTQTLNIGKTEKEVSKTKIMSDLTIDGLISHWSQYGFKNIITMVGAGISTSAGIPDFRSPNTGLYDNLKKYNLADPRAIFDINYFNKNPKPFFELAKELYPGNCKPTPSHYFVRLLHEKGLLVRHYTQNIDTLEHAAGIPQDKLVEAHGTFYTNHCIKCQIPYTKEWVKEYVFKDEIPLCTICQGVVKPDIIFFGEALPHEFYTKPPKDFPMCDLVIIMGTSLEVFPFATLLDFVHPNVVRLIVNRTRIVDVDENNIRDVEYLGNCDDAVWRICDGLGWSEELRTLMDSDEKDQIANNFTETKKLVEENEDKTCNEQKIKVESATSKIK